MKNKTLIIIITLLLMPFVSALSYGNPWNSWLNSPEYYFNSPWIIFIAIFIVSFAIIFYTVNKSFKNPAVAAVIGIGLSLLISVTAAQRGWLYGYVGSDLGGWIMILTFLIGFGFLIKFIHSSFGTIGTWLVAIGVWFLLFITDPYEILPYEFMTPTFISAYEFVTSIWGLVVLIIILFLVGKFDDKKSPFEQFKGFFKK